MTLVKDNTWAIQDIKMPSDEIEVRNILLRHNGNIFVLAKDSNTLYYGEIKG